jgi:fructose-1,6-bisphosphatase/inositol monophosphatase family enzyme
VIHDRRTEIAPEAMERFQLAALRMVDASRSTITQALQQGFQVEKKSDASFLTSVDLAVEKQLRRTIVEQFPEHGIVGEEFPPHLPSAAYQWIMDPIDGTEDFAQGIPTFGTILALYYHGHPLIGVLDHPLLDVRVWAAYGRGTHYNGRRIRLAELPAAATDGSERVMLGARANFIRYRDDGRRFDAVVHAHPNVRIYRTCFAHACVAGGRADAMVDYHVRQWDIAATRILVEEAGGRYEALQEFATPDGGKVYSAAFGKPALVERLAVMLRE